MTRAKKFKNPVTLAANVEKEEAEALDSIRWRERKDTSEIIRTAIQVYIKAHAEGNDTFTLDNWKEDPNFKAVPTILAPNEKWFSYLKGCKKEEKLELLKQANAIRKLVIAAGLK